MTTSTKRMLIVTGVALVAIIAVVAFGGILALLRLSSRSGAPLITPGTARTSPSGDFTADVVLGPKQNGVTTWQARIKNRDDEIAFLDTYAYSTRHRLRIAWDSDDDRLWLVSSDVGTSVIERVGGTWSKREAPNQAPKELTDR